MYSYELTVITELIASLVEKHVPKVRPSHARRWWTDDLAGMRREVNRAGRLTRQHRGDPTHPCHADLRKLRNRYKEEVEKQKRRHWLQFVEDIDPDSIWIANRYIGHESSDASRAQVPTLCADIGHGVEGLSENSQKGEALYRSFFIPPPPADVPHIDPATGYPEPAFRWRAALSDVSRRTKRLARTGLSTSSSRNP